MRPSQGRYNNLPSNLWQANPPLLGDLTNNEGGFTTATFLTKLTKCGPCSAARTGPVNHNLQRPSLRCCHGRRLRLRFRNHNYKSRRLRTATPRKHGCRHRTNRKTIAPLRIPTKPFPRRQHGFFTKLSSRKNGHGFCSILQ